MTACQFKSCKIKNQITLPHYDFSYFQIFNLSHYDFTSTLGLKVCQKILLSTLNLSNNDLNLNTFYILRFGFSLNLVTV